MDWKRELSAYRNVDDNAYMAKETASKLFGERKYVMRKIGSANSCVQGSLSKKLND